MKPLILFFTLISVLLFLGCQSSDVPGSVNHIKKVTSAIDDDMLIGGNQNNDDWLSYGLNFNEDRYSKLDQINKNNIGDLNLAWALELGVMRGIEATPVVVDGIMFLTGPWSIVYAIDARKGTINGNMILKSLKHMQKRHAAM